MALIPPVLLSGKIETDSYISLKPQFYAAFYDVCRGSCYLRHTCGGVARAARGRLRQLIRKNTLSEKEPSARGRFPSILVEISTQEVL